MTRNVLIPTNPVSTLLFLPAIQFCNCVFFSLTIILRSHLHTLLLLLLLLTLKSYFSAALFFASGEKSSFDYHPYVSNIYSCTLTRLKAADIDQEVKERAISCM